MKKTIKRIIVAIITIIMCLSFVLITAEGSIALNAASVAAFAVSTRLLDKLGVFNGEGVK